MSFHLDQEKGKPLKIEMPPLAEESVAAPEAPQVVENQTQNEPEMVEMQTSAPEPAAEEAPAPLQQPKVGPQESFSKLRKERDELAKRLASYESQQQRYEQPKPQTQQEEPELDFNMNPDDLVEGKHLKQYAKKVQQLEQQLSQYQKQTAVSVTEARLKAQFPDFDQVVTGDNIEQLRYAYPELAATIGAGNDMYSSAVSAYTMIKKLGIMPEPVNNYAVDRAQAQRNMSKPKPLASVSPQQGDSPLSKANAFANGLTDDLKSQLLKEMYAARRDH